jgi:hypothetical protein
MDMEQARESFANHQITKSGGGRWLVKKPGTSTFWFEVIVLEGGKLMVHGDISPVIFAYYHPNQHSSAEENAEGCVRWMASRKRPDDPYFTEKAKIGSSSDDTVWTYDEDTLREEIEALIDETHASEAEAEFDGDDHRKHIHIERRESFQEALDGVGGTSLEETQSLVYDALDGDAESVPFGVRVSTSMIYAHAALQRLDALLKETEVRADLS